MVRGRISGRAKAELKLGRRLCPVFRCSELEGGAAAPREPKFALQGGASSCRPVMPGQFAEARLTPEAAEGFGFRSRVEARRKFICALFRCKKLEMRS